MTIYHFMIRDDAGHNEDLAGMAFLDDEAAVAFGKSVIQDILRDHAPINAGATMDITMATHIRSVPFDFETRAEEITAKPGSRQRTG